MKKPFGGRLFHRKGILIWVITLVLILACAPVIATPIPPIDANEVNLFIKQTADAAAAQTQRALPTSSPTAMLTVTPPNTATLEATFTPVPTFLLSTPTRLQTVQYFRVKHDTQLEVYNYKSRTSEWDLAQAAEVVPLFGLPKASAGTERTTLTDRWEFFMNDLNGFDAGKLNYLKAPDTALFNTSGFPQLESLTMGGNIVTLDEISGGWGRVHTMNYSSPGSAQTENYGTRPDLVHKFVVVVWSRKTKSTYWINPPKGDIYWPFVSSHPVWVPMDRLEKFPTLPMLVTAKVEQDIKREPKADASSTGETLAVDEKVTVNQYYPSGSSVWGRLPGGKWIALFRYTQNGPTYFTSWNMETLPPPP